MYAAKQAGKNCYRLFDTKQDEAIIIQRESIDTVRLALEREEFVLYHQAKVNMYTGKVTGIKALIRWQHPVQGIVPPLKFLPAAEDHAISLEVSEWKLDDAWKS